MSTTKEQREWKERRKEHQYELAQGDTVERTRQLGAASIEASQQQFGANPKESDAWQRTQSRGAESLALLSDQPLDVRAGAAPRGGGGAAAAAKRSGAQFGGGGDDVDGGGGDGGSAEFAPPPPSDDEEWLTDSSDEEGDPAHEDAVLDEDWDTSAWSAQEIETACETLIEEVEAAEEEKRGAQATRMLLRLLARHKEAREYMETALESLVLKGTRTPEKKLGVDMVTTFKVAALLASASLPLAGKMSRLLAAPKLTHCLCCEMGVATRLVQHTWRSAREQRRAARRGGGGREGAAAAARGRYLARLKQQDLHQQWCRLHRTEGGGRLPDGAMASYLRALVVLTAPRGSRSKPSALPSKDRQRIVRGGGLVPAVHVLRENAGAETEVGELAAALLLNIAREASLLLPLLRADVATPLCAMLRPELPVAVVCSALDVIDMMAHSALAQFDINTDRVPDPDEDSNAAADAAEAAAAFPLGAAAGGRERMRLLPALKEAVERRLAAKPLLRALVKLLSAPAPELRVGTLLALHKLACGAGFHPVLGALLEMGGAALHVVVGMLRGDGMEGEDPMLLVPAQALLAQLCSRPEGRAGLQSGGAVQLLLSLCAPPRGMAAQAAFAATGAKPGTATTRFVRALGVLLGLAQAGVRKSLLPHQLELRQTPRGAVAALFRTGLRLMTASAPPGAAASAVATLEQLGVMELVVRWLVEPSNPVFVYEMERTTRFASAIVLGRLAERRSVAARHLAAAVVVDHLFRVLQVNRVDELEGGDADLEDEERALRDAANSAACVALRRICLCAPRAGSRALVGSAMLRLACVDDLVGMLLLPPVRGGNYRALLDRADASAALLGAIVPVTTTEATAVAALENCRSVGEAVDDGHATLLVARLAREASKAVVRLAATDAAPSSIVAHCFAALGRFASTRESADIVLKAKALGAVLRALPQALGALAAGGGHMTQAERAAGGGRGVVVDAAANADEQGATGHLPHGLWATLARLAVSGDGREAMCDLDLVAKAVARLVSSAGADPGAALAAAGGGGGGGGGVEEGGALDALMPPLPAASASEREELALLCSRLANTHTTEHGSANEVLLRPPVLRVLVRMLHPRAGQRDCAAGRGTTRAGRYYAALALAELAADASTAVPALVAAGVLPALAPLVNGFYATAAAEEGEGGEEGAGAKGGNWYTAKRRAARVGGGAPSAAAGSAAAGSAAAAEKATTAEPLLRQALRIVFGVTSYPMQQYNAAVAHVSISGTLLRVACDFQLEMRKPRSQPLSIGTLARDVHRLMGLGGDEGGEGGPVEPQQPGGSDAPPPQSSSTSSRSPPPPRQQQPPPPSVPSASVASSRLEVAWLSPEREQRGRAPGAAAAARAAAALPIDPFASVELSKYPGMRQTRPAAPGGAQVRQQREQAERRQLAQAQAEWDAQQRAAEERRERRQQRRAEKERSRATAARAAASVDSGGRVLMLDPTFGGGVDPAIAAAAAAAGVGLRSGGGGGGGSGRGGGVGVEQFVHTVNAFGHYVRVEGTRPATTKGQRPGGGGSFPRV
jgi:hypothetical protein